MTIIQQGVLATGFFASPRLMELAYGGEQGYSGLFYSNGNLLGCQFIMIIFIIAWVFFTMFPFFIWLNYRGWFRADSLEEIVGLDISYHGRSPDTDDVGVKEEYIEAFKNQRGATRGRRVGNFDDPELDQ